MANAELKKHFLSAGNSKTLEKQTYISTRCCVCDQLGHFCSQGSRRCFSSTSHSDSPEQLWCGAARTAQPQTSANSSSASTWTVNHVRNGKVGLSIFSCECPSLFRAFRKVPVLPWCAQEECGRSDWSTQFKLGPADAEQVPALKYNSDNLHPASCKTASVCNSEETAPALELTCIALSPPPQEAAKQHSDGPLMSTFSGIGRSASPANSPAAAIAASAPIRIACGTPRAESGEHGLWNGLAPAPMCATNFHRPGRGRACYRTKSSNAGEWGCAQQPQGFEFVPASAPDGFGSRVQLPSGAARHEVSSARAKYRRRKSWSGGLPWHSADRSDAPTWSHLPKRIAPPQSAQNRGTLAVVCLDVAAPCPPREASLSLLAHMAAAPGNSEASAGLSPRRSCCAASVAALLPEDGVRSRTPPR